MKHYDVVVVGAGIVGAACALKLQQQGLDVALIDQQSPQSIGALPDARVSAINNASSQFLQTLKVWQELPQERLTPILAMKIFTLAEALDFDAAEFGFSELGFILENKVLAQALLKKFLAQADANFYLGSVQELERNKFWEINVEGAEAISLSARLLIVAQGAQSNLRALLKNQVSVNFYQQKALVVNVESSLPHRFTAYQRFLPTGPLAFLPLFQKNWSSIVWTLPTALADEYLQLSVPEFMQKLQAAFPDLGALSALTPVYAFELTALAAENYSGEGYVLVGDSAHTVHPLAGQGVNMGLADVQLLCQILADDDQRMSGRALNEYARRAQFRNASLSKSFAVLNRLFQLQSSLALRVLNFGLHKINHWHGVKRQLLQIARGDGV